MNILRKSILLLAAASAASICAQDPWLHVYYPNGEQFRQFDMSEVLDVTFDQESGTMKVATLDDEIEIIGSHIDHFTVGPNVPAIYLTSPDVYNEVYSKEIYANGNIQFKGMGIWDDIETTIQFRGRGNSTWGYPKKPYRIKFSEKTKLGSLKKAKNYVLLANYIDPSMMRNFVAFKVEELIGMPYPNHAMPVNVYINGYYKGAYMATEKVGFNNGSVDLDKETEAASVLYELDTNNATSDEFPFDSDYFDYDYDGGSNLPVRIKDPDAPTDAKAQEEWFDKWVEEFDNLMYVIERGDEKEIFENIDLETLAKYILTFNVCCNQELCHPKSVFLYKIAGDKFYFGPGWDFDWAFGYQPTYTNWNSWSWSEDTSYKNPLLGYGHQDHAGAGNDGNGGLFFYKICNNATFKAKYKEVWDDFYQNHLPEFWAAFDEYAAMLKPSAHLQSSESKIYRGYESNVEELRQWVSKRIEYINSDENYGLWQDSSFDLYY